MPKKKKKKTLGALLGKGKGLRLRGKKGRKVFIHPGGRRHNQKKKTPNLGAKEGQSIRPIQEEELGKGTRSDDDPLLEEGKGPI